MANVKVRGANGLMVMDAGSLAAEFEAGFWELYPRRMAKKDALKAYMKARAMATESEILAGVERYLLHKPSYADWKLPAGWLRDERWNDEYDTPRPRTVTPKAFEQSDLHQQMYRNNAAYRASYDAKTQAS